MLLSRGLRLDGYGQRHFKGLLTVLNAVLDEILQVAVLAQQAVPWLFSGPSGRTLR